MTFFEVAFGVLGALVMVALGLVLVLFIVLMAKCIMNLLSDKWLD